VGRNNTHKNTGATAHGRGSGQLGKLIASFGRKEREREKEKNPVTLSTAVSDGFNERCRGSNIDQKDFPVDCPISEKEKGGGGAV